MYQVISVRVLRQVMDWMGIPSPWFRTTQFFRWPDGRLTSTIKCMWNYSEIVPFYEDYCAMGPERWPTYEKSEMAAALWQRLEAAFCEDIRVVTCRYEYAANWFVAWLTCTIEPDAHAYDITGGPLELEQEGGAL